MASVYVDEDFPYPVVLELRNLEHDLLTAYEAGEANLKFFDERVGLVARRMNRIILTHNWDHFRRYHRNNSDHNGIIICTRDDDVLGLAVRVHEALLANADFKGKLVKVIKPNPSSKKKNS